MWSFDKYSKSIAVIDELGNGFSYVYLKEEGQKIADEIGRRCLVMLLCSNELGSLAGYTALIENGIVPIMVDAKLDRQLLVSLADTYKVDYIWTPATVADVFLNCKQVYSAHNYSLLKTSFDASFSLNENLALLLTTSGSTGSFKLVRISYKNLLSNTEAIAQYLNLDETERAITTLPMNYTYGLSIINTHLFVGASIILTEKTLMQKEFWQQLKTYEATSFGGVPYIYEMLDKLRFTRMTLPKLRTMTQAGGKLSPELHKKFAQYAADCGKHFIVMYGQTEATARMAYLPWEKSLEKYGSMGIAIPGGRFELIDVDGKTIDKPDVVGELVYYGDNVTMGYATSGEDLAKGDEWHGRLVTGDMAKVDADGYHYVTGRKKRFLKIFGSRVNLDETEGLLKTEFPQIECVCGGVDDKMYVFVTDAEKCAEVKNFLTAKLNFNSSAFTTVALDEIPRNNSGKVLYADLAAYYGKK